MSACRARTRASCRATSASSARSARASRTRPRSSSRRRPPTAGRSSCSTSRANTSRWTSRPTRTDAAGRAGPLRPARRQGSRDFHVYLPGELHQRRGGQRAVHPPPGRLRHAASSARSCRRRCRSATPCSIASSTSQQKARTKVATQRGGGLEPLLDASPQAKLPFTLRTLKRAGRRALVAQHRVLRLRRACRPSCCGCMHAGRVRPAEHAVARPGRGC